MASQQQMAVNSAQMGVQQAAVLQQAQQQQQQLSQQQDFDPVHRFKMLIPLLKDSLQVCFCVFHWTRELEVTLRVWNTILTLLYNWCFQNVMTIASLHFGHNAATYFSRSVKYLKHLYCVISADTHLSTTSISKQKRLSIESVFLLIQDFSLNFSVGFDMTPFCERRETDSEDLMQTAPLFLQMTETWASLYLFSCGFCLCVAHAEDVAAFFERTIMAYPCATQRP